MPEDPHPSRYLKIWPAGETRYVALVRLRTQYLSLQWTIIPGQKQVFMQTSARYQSWFVEDSIGAQAYDIK